MGVDDSYLCNMRDCRADNRRHNCIGNRRYYSSGRWDGVVAGRHYRAIGTAWYGIGSESSVEQYYNTVIVIDYQLQIPLHFGSTAKTEPCEYHFSLLT